MKYCLFSFFALLASMAGYSQTTYTFTGNGYWTQAGNWQSLSVPPDTLPAGSVINISPAPNDSCVLDKVQVIAPGASLHVLTGSNFIVPSGMIITASLPSLTTIPVSDISGNYALSGGSISANGGSPVLSKGVVWSVNTNPEIASGTLTTDGSGNANYGSYLRNLLPNTQYYIRAYATNSTGTGYGNELSFTSTADLLPVVSVRVDTIRATTASATGSISSDFLSIITHGFCWDTARMPTITLPTKTVKGTPQYPFSFDALTNLLPRSTYYIRAYATNSFGTAYSSEYLFFTDSLKVPDVSINTLTGNADFLGSIDGIAVASGYASTNGSPITVKGICWDSVPDPVITSGDTTVSDGGTGGFSGTLTNLVPNTTYYVRAYATNAIGTGYSSARLIRAWMPSNLDIVTYRNGDTIPQVTDSATWANLTTGAWCYYNNDSANGAIYGKLYNFYALTDPRGFTPVGWRLPTEDDWNTSQSGGRMKTTTLWMPPNTGATNSSRFSGLPGGLRLPDANFAGSQGYYGEWWSDYRFGYLFARRLSYNSASSSQAYTNVNVPAAMRTGRSVRCVKE
ncbi:MAG: fibrobacter succinogenes major paralogous domain-containing protein [Bacteroidota bacterium]